MAVNDVNIRIRAQDDTKGAFGSVKSSLGGLRSSIFSVQTALAGIAGSLVAKTVIDANRSFQSLQASLITFTGSAEAANRQFAVLQDFAAKTPFSLEEVVGGFNKLVARGITPSIESLTAFGNIASGTGKSLDQFIEAVADAAVGEFERLKEFGIKANSEGDRIKLTFGGVTKTVGKNSQEMLSYLESLGQTKFAGAIERQSKTLNGAFSNLGDSTSKLAVAIGEAGLNGALVSVTKEMSRLIDVTTQATQAQLGFIDVIGITLRDALNSTSDSLKTYREDLETLKKGRSILDFLGLDLSNTDQEIADVQKKINILLGVGQTNFRGRGLADPRMTGRVGTVQEQTAKKVIELTKEQQKAIDDYKQSIIDAETNWAGAMTQSERQARNRLQVIEDTKKSLTDFQKQQFQGAFSGYLDKEQRGKRQNSLPAELEAIRESLVEVKSPLKDFSDSMPTLNQAMEAVVVGGMKSLEDSLVGLVNGTMSAKDAFKSMANSIINDLIRMAIQQQITAPLAQMFGLQAAAPSVPLTGKAIGGSVQAGQSYMVGERGAELFVPNQSGSIIPNNQLGGGGTTIVQNINVTTGVQQTVRAEIMTLMPQIANAAKSAVADAKLRGGSYAAAMR